MHLVKRFFFISPPKNSRVKNFVGHLINVSKGHIPNLGPLGPLLHVEKFVVGGGGGCGGGGCVRQF